MSNNVDIDVSKENIQPLRGGRNADQLVVGLQAQDSEVYQQELLHQKETYENAIRNYEGDDPLDLWYQYISWVEQSYPKHGHEGNLGPLLESCLAKFEADERYTHDRRFCKLWLKFIDAQPNPLELYQMMHARGLCTSCSDFYIAWAYYHEIARDFKSADAIFELGKSVTAQPYDQLYQAHHRMVINAGEHALGKVDHRSLQLRLQEQRQALTSLSTYRPGKVGSKRTASSETPGIVRVAEPVRERNERITVYEDSTPSTSRAVAPPESLIKIARSLDIAKENALKPGTWAVLPNKKIATGCIKKSPNFNIHEDGWDLPPRPLSIKFPPETCEDFSDFQVLVCFAEPEDPTKIPMYPKKKVYSTQTDLSLEEIRANRYKSKDVSASANGTVMQKQQNAATISPGLTPNASFMKTILEPSIKNDNNLSMQQIQDKEMQELSQKSTHEALNFQKNENLWKNRDTLENDSGNSPFDITWQKDNHDHIPDTSQYFPFNASTSFRVAPEMQPKASAMKTPFKVLTADDLAETGSRGGLDVAAAAQPMDGAKRVVIYEDDSSSPFGGGDGDRISVPIHQTFNLNFDSLDTQQFNFNLNLSKVSTPQKVAPSAALCEKEEPWKEQPEKLSTIFEEETKSLGSSTVSTQKSSHGTPSNNLVGNLLTISEEHNRNLAANLMANAALRSSLGDLIMDCDPPHVVIEEAPMPVARINPEPMLPTIVPLEPAPSDPFKPALTNLLLARIGFPGRHSHGYIEVPMVPRLQLRKESIRIGNERYFIDKQLGKGSFGMVFRALCRTTKNTVALKYQKPANKWEFYICRELVARLASHPLCDRFMNIHIGYYCESSSVLVSDYCPCGSLLDVKNSVKQKSGRSMKETLCIYFSIEMLRVVTAMHSAQIIHADVKPDNFLVQLRPDSTVTLQLIDFGCAIDMAMFPPGTMFKRQVTTENFVCCEMKDGRPWSYHTDLFCIAATTHTLLFDKYISLQKKEGNWSITQKMFRYMKVDLWNTFFSSLLNQQDSLADTEGLQSMLSAVLQTETDFPADMRYLVNILNNR